MTGTLGGLYTRLKQELSASGIENSDLEARFILKHRLNADFGDIISKKDRKIEQFEINLIESDLKRRKNGEPLSRIQGFREFMGLEFRLGADTLDPRPDTETLVNHALKLFHGKHPARVLDLGTGTGCIIIALLKAWPACRGVATDLSEGALKIAKLNAEDHGVADRLELVRADWAEGISIEAGGPFDLIVSNPPYIRTQDIESLDKNVRNHDPILALDGGFDGLEAYRKIFFSLKRLLTPCGKALFEIGAGQEADFARLSRESRIRVNNTQPDLAGITRVVEIVNGDK